MPDFKRGKIVIDFSTLARGEISAGSHGSAAIFSPSSSWLWLDILSWISRRDTVRCVVMEIIGRGAMLFPKAAISEGIKQAAFIYPV